MDVEMDEPQKTIKVVVVGDGAAGKTAMIETYIKKRFPAEYARLSFSKNACLTI